MPVPSDNESTTRSDTVNNTDRQNLSIPGGFPNGPVDDSKADNGSASPSGATSPLDSHFPSRNHSYNTSSFFEDSPNGSNPHLRSASVNDQGQSGWPYSFKSSARASRDFTSPSNNVSTVVTPASESVNDYFDSQHHLGFGAPMQPIESDVSVTSPSPTDRHMNFKSRFDKLRHKSVTFAGSERPRPGPLKLDKNNSEDNNGTPSGTTTHNNSEIILPFYSRSTPTTPRHSRPSSIYAPTGFQTAPNVDHTGTIDERVERAALPRRAASTTDLPATVNEKRRNIPTRPTLSSRIRSGFHEHHKNSPSKTHRRQAAIHSKWQNVKHNLRNITRKKKKPPHHWEIRSTALVSEMSAGIPAALLVGAEFYAPERRLPVLLEQLNIFIVHVDSSRSRDPKFTIELTYCSGLTMMRWRVVKEFRDFLWLHSRFRVADLPFTRKLCVPKFPKEVAPYVRGFKENDIDSDDLAQLSESNEVQRIPTTGNQSLSWHRGSASAGADDALENEVVAKVRDGDRTVSAFQASKLEIYLRELAKALLFRPEANHLCRFFELSRMSMRLAGEQSYKGKEGTLIMNSSASSSGWRTSRFRAHDIKEMWIRHTSKWYLVRHSYIVCVDALLDLSVQEVFMVDPDFKCVSHVSSKKAQIQKKGNSLLTGFQLSNRERKLNLLCGSHRTLHQWIKSIEHMVTNTIWSRPHRFDSFAPVRYGAKAQWFVDARDYFWNVSAALDRAKDTIYIHDWWLSPELYLRRPVAACNQRWRIDRILKRRAKAGVKIFIIIYRNVGTTIPIDSSWTKHSMLNLHPNVYLMRSPNQFLQKTFFWAHHEKLVMVDSSIAFLGGIDLCFGRWDTPQHVLADDKPAGFDMSAQQALKSADHLRLWQGKDYSNPRVKDFFSLDKPYEDMYDRSITPRMPWHDVHMQIVGQPARDLCRHFVQRWNYLLRQKRPSRRTPFLVPPPDFTAEELAGLDYNGSCEVQLLRSACSWSLGLHSDKYEKSIEEAYVQTIDKSEHFIYIENQFFISSTFVENAQIHNRIGDALVSRIIRANDHDEMWRAIIIIPLMPGFESEVDQNDATSVRLIMQCQYRSISRGSNSIFGRLIERGINPADYIQFFSLRKWAKLDHERILNTEQLYIHAKILIADDRVAIVGSANINERSMRGLRDSEVAAIIRDTAVIDSYMGGEPYKVGKFPHTLRMRLMREHLGVDVDILEEIVNQTENAVKEKLSLKDGQANGNENSTAKKKRRSSSGSFSDIGNEFGGAEIGVEERIAERLEEARQRSTFLGFNNEAGAGNVGLCEGKALSVDSRLTNNKKHDEDVDGNGVDNCNRFEKETTKKQVFESANPASEFVNKINIDQVDLSCDDENERTRRLEEFMRKEYDGACSRRCEKEKARTASLSSSESGQGDHSDTSDASNSNNNHTNNNNNRRAFGLRLDKEDCLDPANIDPFGFKDPIDDKFYIDLFLRAAVQNTEIFRQVFRCQPDDKVKTWKDYKESVLFFTNFMNMQMEMTKKSMQQAANGGNTGDILKGVNTEKAASSPSSSSYLDKAPENGVEKNINNEGAIKTAVGISKDINQEKIQKTKSQVAKNIRADMSDCKSSVGVSNQKKEVEEEDKGNEKQQRDEGENGDPSATTRNGTALRNRGTTNTSTSTNGGGRQRGMTMMKELPEAYNYLLRDGMGKILMDRAKAEELLQLVCGHIVIFPTEWLVSEEESGNWFFNMDLIPPIEIYD